MEQLKQKVTNRELTLGTMLSELAEPNIVRILKTAGFEFVIIDCEHGYFDLSQTAALIGMGSCCGLPVFVRVPSTRREYITKVMDMGAAGLLVPMVNSAEDARQAVEYAKYTPLGKRGISTQRAHTNYAPPPLEEYLKMANQRTMIMVQLETREALGHIREIAETEGVDALMIGPNDLAADLGMPGQVESKEILKAAELAAEEAARAGKSSGIITSKKTLIHSCRELGMNLFSCDSEVGMLIKAAKQSVQQFWQK